MFKMSSEENGMNFFLKKDGFRIQKMKGKLKSQEKTKQNTKADKFVVGEIISGMLDNCGSKLLWYIQSDPWFNLFAS